MMLSNSHINDGDFSCHFKNTEEFENNNRGRKKESNKIKLVKKETRIDYFVILFTVQLMLVNHRN